MCVMAPTKPTLELLRSLSDEHVLRALMDRRRATRAEIAAATGLSKPTVSESVRRLSDAGAVVDTGERTTGRGRVGTYYALAPTSGHALVASLAPEGIVAEAVDVYGDVVPRAEAPARGADVAATPARARRRSGPYRLAVISAADPVDRASGRLVELPDAPFLLGALDPAAVLADVVTARSPSTTTSTGPPAPRIARTTSSTCTSARASGCAVVSDGEVRRGHAGVAGEIAHVVTTGPDGAAMRFTDVFAALGLRRARLDGDRRRALLRAASTTSASRAPSPASSRRPSRFADPAAS